MACIKRQKSRPAFAIVLADADVKVSLKNERYFTDKCWFAYHNYAKWVIKTTRKTTSGLSLTERPKREEIIAQAKILCREYVSAKLMKTGLLDVKEDEKYQRVRPCTDVSREVQYLGGELHKMYPDLYKSITKQLNIKINSEAVVKANFMAVADQLYRHGKVTWGRIIALFAIANAFSSDCIQHGHPELVSVVIETFGQITSLYTADWICREGGWTDILRAFRTSHDAPVVWMLSVIGALVGFLMTVAATLQL